MYGSVSKAIGRREANNSLLLAVALKTVAESGRASWKPKSDITPKENEKRLRSSGLLTRTRGKS